MLACVAAMVATASCVCGPGLSSADAGDGGVSSTGGATQGSTEGEEPKYEELWRLSLDRSIKTEPPVGDERGDVYVMAIRDDPTDPGGVELHSLIKVDAQGELAWELDFGSSPGLSGVAVGPNGDIWVCVRGAVSRVSAEGSLLWTEDDACSGERSISVGREGSVSVSSRMDDDEIGNDIYVQQVIAIDAEGNRLWARDVGVPRPSGPDQFKRLGTAIAGVALSGTSVYVGCDICSEQPALVELDLADGSIRGVGELPSVDWTEPRRTVFETPRVTADGVFVEAYEELPMRRTWHWSGGSSATTLEVSLPIEADTGLTHRDYSTQEAQLVVDGEARVIDFDGVAPEERPSLLSGEPAARGMDDAILMVSIPDPPEEYPRTYNCWGETCRVYVVDAAGRVSWLLDEEVVSIPYVGAGRIVYVAPNGDLVAHSTPLTPRTFGWAQWLANGQGNGCRDCGG